MSSQYYRSYRKKMKKDKLKGKEHPCLGKKLNGEDCGRVVRGGWLCPDCKSRFNYSEGIFGDHYEFHSPE